MFNALRNKMMALAAFAASLVRPGDNPTPSGPEITHHSDPAFRQINRIRHRKNRFRVGIELEPVEMADPYSTAGIKLAKRFAEAPHRNARGY